MERYAPETSKLSDRLCDARRNVLDVELHYLVAGTLARVLDFNGCDEVVQLYIKYIAASITQPVRKLRGFRRITLQPLETRRIEFTLTPQDFGFYNRDLRFVAEPGKIDVIVGTSSVGGLEASFEVVGK